MFGAVGFRHCSDDQRENTLNLLFDGFLEMYARNHGDHSLSSVQTGV
jgi:hypothetical protein